MDFGAYAHIALSSAKTGLVGSAGIHAVRGVASTVVDDTHAGARITGPNKPGLNRLIRFSQRAHLQEIPCHLAKAFGELRLLPAGHSRGRILDASSDQERGKEDLKEGLGPHKMGCLSGSSLAILCRPRILCR